MEGVFAHVFRRFSSQGLAKDFPQSKFDSLALEKQILEVKKIGPDIYPHT
jgi:hypothetical protein